MNERILKNALVCPNCKEPFELRGNSLVCHNGHTYDLSKEGYVNLAGSRHNGGGDSKELVSARAAFLAAGYYEKFADTVCERLDKYSHGGVIIDAGCGEGYYSLRAARGASADVCGFDLSKPAVSAAAKAAKRQSIDALFSVAGIFDMPLADGCADAVMNLFAPCAEEEFCRVLKSGGYLIVAGAGEDHLDGLKAVLYDEVTKNQPRADLPEGMTLVSRERIVYEIELRSREDIMSLFSMTPYYYRTSAAGRERLAMCDTVRTTVDFDLFVYKKSSQ